VSQQWNKPLKAIPPLCRRGQRQRHDENFANNPAGNRPKCHSPGTATRAESRSVAILFVPVLAVRWRGIEHSHGFKMERGRPGVNRKKRGSRASLSRAYS
jgi:hypothetical protein